MRTARLLGSLLLSVPLWSAPEKAEACGSFFCSTTPVDQNAERIIFKVREDGRTDMIVQIAYQGDAPSFAWLMPLAEPPSRDDLGIFPQLAMVNLDGRTSPTVSGNFCWEADFASAPTANPNAVEDEGGVNVYLRDQVGNYEVAVIGSDDASASAKWLRDNGFRISDAMDGFIQLYTEDEMKFLALKLLPGKDVTDITPFKVTLPGTSPSIPLRMTAVAAEPEMGIVTWIFANERYAPANAAEILVDDADLRVDPQTGNHNWLAVVAREVDEAKGRGWVVEDAEPVEGLRSFVESSFTDDPDQLEARDAMLEVLSGVTYMTRLYTRLSPEEMTYDPVFRSSSGGDVSRFHRAGGENDCSDELPPVTPCDFTACGALGLCREVAMDEDGAMEPACACAPGFTARTTFVPSLNGDPLPTVSCVDKRLSFINPGDKNEQGEALPDPCVGFECGTHGSCVPMNMTPTCECEEGYVARGFVSADGSRGARCEVPMQAVPKEFYNRRPLDRDAKLPIGREVEYPVVTGPSDPADPMSQGDADAPGPKAPGKKPGSGSKCSVDAGSADRGLSLLGLLGLGAALALRRRRR